MASIYFYLLSINPTKSESSVTRSAVDLEEYSDELKRDYANKYVALCR